MRCVAADSSPPSRRPDSQVLRFGRWIPPIVVSAVHVTHGQLRELLGIDIVETGDIDRIVGAADLLDVAVAERGDAARLAEPMVAALAAELIVRDVGLAGQQPKILRLDDRAPVSPLGADRAVALAGSGAEVDIGLEANIAAMAAAAIGLLHQHRSFTRPQT